VTREERTPRTGPVLGIFAHPDDAEICAGGVLAKWAAAGRNVHLLILTNGDRGSQDPSRDRAELATTRFRETEEAAELLGLASVRVGSIPDSELENSKEVREGVVRRIREIRAETVVTCDPTAVFFDIPAADMKPARTVYNHSDHRVAGAIALDAVFPGAGNPHFFPEHLAEGLTVVDVYDVWLGWSDEPNHAEEIPGDAFDAKVAALGRHASQIDEGIRVWDDWMRDEAKLAGERVGLSLAEEFRVVDLS
jgi:LmbE family N-acetylglucosaminyl deacetylase